MNNDYKKHSIATIILLAIITTVSIIYQPIDTQELIKIDYQNKVMISLVLTIAFGFYYLKFNNIERKKSFKILSVFFTLFLIAGYSIQETSSLKLILDDIQYLSISIIKFIGYYSLINITLNVIFNYLIMLDDIIDYSSICLLVTKTLEVELTERFFKNFVKYLKVEYGKDYSQYHASLLGWDKYNENYYVLKSKKCDLGRITYILGFNKDKSLNEDQHKNNMAKLIEYSRSNLFDNLTDEEIEEKLYQYGSLVNDIRIKYRNPAAHTNKLKRIDAEECFNLIIDVEKVLKKMLDSFNY